jgi:hypothetical protein
MRQGQDRKLGERRGDYTVFEEMVRRCQFGGEILTEKDLRMFIGGRFLFYYFGRARRSCVCGKTTNIYRILGEISEISATFPVVDIDSEWLMTALVKRRWQPSRCDGNFVFVMRSWEYWEIPGAICLHGEDHGTYMLLIPPQSLGDVRLEDIPIQGPTPT